MLVIKLNAIDSTNTYLRNLTKKEKIDDYTVVVTKSQLEGRGQMGTVWQSENDKNLLFSVFKKLSNLDLENSFVLSMAMSLSIIKTLKEFKISNLKVKWPNDILSDSDKICGILIETVIKNNKLNSCIIGVGLNVNQTDFNGLPNASSLKLISSETFDLDKLLKKIILQFKKSINRLDNKSFKNLKKEYEAYLFRINKPSTFKDSKGELFPGYIKGISNSGKLKVLLEDELIKEFELKEVTLMY